MRFGFSLLVALFFTIMLNGCGTPSRLAVKYQPVVNFADHTSYGLYPRADKFNDWQSLSDGMRNSIELAIERSMDDLGYDLKDPSQADVVVTYYLVKQNNRTFRLYNQGVNYCSYCLMHTKSGSRKDLLTYYPGSLVIDVIKPKSRRTIWRSTYPLRIKDKDNSLEINNKIAYAVDLMLQQLATRKQPANERA